MILFNTLVLITLLLDLVSGDATTTICHRNTPPEQLRVFTQTADILVVATGIPGLIKADMVKEGVAVIDVGITETRSPKTGRRKLIGDVDFNGRNSEYLVVICMAIL